MRLYDRVAARLQPRTREIPVPAVAPWEEGQPYSTEETAPAKYGDYLATSNDVYSCAWLRAKTLSPLPWLVHGGGGKLLEPQAPLPSLLRRPNPHMTGLKVKAHVELCLAIWGRAVLLLERGSPNLRVPPREMWPVKPTLIRAVPHRTDFISGYIYQPPGGGAAIPLRPDEVIDISYPNPTDLYAPLPPMAAVRLAAEVASESMKANRQLFRQGMSVGGFVMPPDKDASYTAEQAHELEKLISQRFSGSANAHRWQVLRYFLTLKDMAVTPKDAQWIEGANLTFRQVARGMGVPPPLVGDAEYATLANLTVYERALWEHTLQFEAEYISAEMTRQLVPAFQAASRIELDLSDVVALQEDETVKWRREKDQIDRGAITINEWRVEQGLDKVPWGDAWWAPLTVAPVADGERPPAPAAALTAPRSRAWQRPPELVEFEDSLYEQVRAVTVRLKDAVLQQLRQGERSVSGSADDPFDRARWRERMRQAGQGPYEQAALWVAAHEAELLGLTPDQIVLLLKDRALLAAVEALIQTFAREVVETTWQAVKEGVSVGAQAGETLDLISDRVAHIMDVRIQDARRTATTEVTRASSTGQLAAFDTAGVGQKRWVTMADGAVRDSHVTLHGLAVPLTSAFLVGGYPAAGPGLTGVPAMDVNCRCRLEPVRET